MNHPTMPSAQEAMDFINNIAMAPMPQLGDAGRLKVVNSLIVLKQVLVEHRAFEQASKTEEKEKEENKKQPANA